jgi:hypothetical protein
MTQALLAALLLALSHASAEEKSWSFKSVFGGASPLQPHLDCYSGLRQDDAPVFPAARDGVAGFYFISPHGAAFRPASEETNYFRVPMAAPMSYFRCSRRSCMSSNTALFWGEVKWTPVDVFTGADDPQIRQAVGGEIVRLIAARGDALNRLADKPAALRQAGTAYSRAMDACAKVQDPAVEQAVASRRR